MITIEEDTILFERAATCQKILQLAGDHADEWDSLPEGILVLLFPIVYACNQYNIGPRELASSIKKAREIVTRAQGITGKKAPLSEVIFESGVN